MAVERGSRAEDLGPLRSRRFRRSSFALAYRAGAARSKWRKPVT